MAYDMFLRKDTFEGKTWYNEFCLFCSIGVCAVPDGQAKEVREALALFLYATRAKPDKKLGFTLISSYGAIEPGDMDAYIQGIRSE